MKKFLFAVAFTTLMFSSSANAGKLFSLELDQGSLQASRSYDSIIDLFDDYENGQLNKIIASYDQTKASSGLVNFRGILMNLHFDDTNAGKSPLTFTVPSLGIVEHFEGATQKESFNQLKEYLKKNRNNLMQKIVKASVKETPFDAVAGNPNSLMSQMVDSAFDRAGGNSIGSVVGYLSPNAAKHKISYRGQDITAKTFSLPIGATFKFGESGWALLWDMPVTYTDLEDSISYMAQMGLGLKIPLAKYWNITPAVRGGIVGSKDMLSGGVLYNATVTSDVAVPVGQWTFGMTNMVGYIRDYSLKVKGYEIDYDLKNQVFKNGVRAQYNFSDKYSAGASYDYTLYTGDDLYIKHYHEVEMSLTRKMEGLISGVSLVGTYTFDKNYKAYRAGMKFSF